MKGGFVISYRKRVDWLVFTLFWMITFILVARKCLILLPWKDIFGKQRSLRVESCCWPYCWRPFLLQRLVSRRAWVTIRLHRDGMLILRLPSWIIVIGFFLLSRLLTMNSCILTLFPRRICGNGRSTRMCSRARMCVGPVVPCGLLLLLRKISVTICSLPPTTCIRAK